MYVENDFLMALVKQEDWLQEPAHRALEEYDDIHTSIAAYTEFLVLAYDQDTGEYQIDVGRALADLVEQIPVRPEVHEQAVLTAAVLADDHGFTPFDAIHGGIAISTGQPILTSERDYDDVGVDRVPLENDS
jgi:predicted nucleic acid-binding protein